MNEIEKAIEDSKDIIQVFKVQHMCQDIDGEVTQEDTKIYKSRFASLNLAISALEKQVPKEPIYISKVWADGQKYVEKFCPKCKEELYERQNYCDKCGQKLECEGITKNG